MSLKFKSIAAIGALIGSLALAGCGQDEKESEPHQGRRDRRR